MASQKIDPLSVITQHTPTPESPKSASSWFKTERMELDFGDYVGRPSENFTAHKEALTALLSDGWYVTAVSNGGSDGEWKHVSTQKQSELVSSTGTSNERQTGKTARTVAENEVGTQSERSTETNRSETEASQDDTKKSVSETKNEAHSESSSEASGYSNANNNYNTFTNATGSKGQTSGGGTSAGTTISNSSTHSTGDSHSAGSVVSTGEGGASSGTEIGKAEAEAEAFAQTSKEGNTKEDATEDRERFEESSQNRDTTGETDVEETDPYWCAWQKIRLERRRMQAELVLQSMVDTFVANFNEGRQINVDRYEELVALYALMVSQTQDDAANIDLDAIDFEPLFDEVKAAITEKLSQYQSVADQIPADWLESRKDDINLKFNNLIAEARAKMISDGTYNGTVWPSVEAGIEHQRSHALDALKDESVTLKLSAYGDIAKTTAALYGQMIDAQVRVFEALKSKKTTPITLRNEVLKWMYDFMERRTDDHVKIEELAGLVQQLGYDGGIVAPSSVTS